MIEKLKAFNMDKSQSLQGFLEFVYDFYKTMKAHEITLVYEGEITHQITKAFTSLAEMNMREEAESGSVQKKVFHVMVECLQNISKHAEDFNNSNQNGAYTFSGRGIFLVSKGDEEYNITTGNIVYNEKIDGLKSFLEHINKLDKKELKELYKEQIQKGKLSDKGGAGLGFIDIRRKTGKSLMYHFLPISDKTSFFLLTSSVARQNL
jgi:hypothetical protein